MEGVTSQPTERKPTVTSRHIDAIRTTLRNRIHELDQPPAPLGHSKHEIIRTFQSEIQLLRARGSSWPEIAKLFARGGLAIDPNTLRISYDRITASRGDTP